MLSTLIKKMFGSRNERTLRRMEKSVMAINAFEPKMQALSNEELAGKTQEFKERFNNGESLDELLAEALLRLEKYHCALSVLDILTYN